MVEAKLSASLIITRPRANGTYEVLLMKRSKGMVFSEAFVFPGGLWDPQDSLDLWGPRLGLRPKVIPKTPATSEVDLNSFKITAIRETFEESGIFIGPGNLGPPKTGDFYELCKSKGTLPDVTRLRYFTRMITPLFVPKRFDTVFFLTSVPTGTSFTLSSESQAAEWLSPEELLNRAAELRLLPPQGFATVLLAHYPIFNDLMQAEVLPTTVFPLMGAIAHPEKPGVVVIVAYGDEDYEVPEFLPEVKGKRMRVWMDVNGINAQISPGMVPFIDSSPYRLLPDSATGRLRITPKARL